MMAVATCECLSLAIVCIVRMFRCLLIIKEVFKNDVATLVDLLTSDSLDHYFTLDNIPMKQEPDWSRSRKQLIVT